MVQGSAPPHVDPYSDAFQQCPYPTYAELRSSSPVHEVADHGFWMVTTMALVREALRDPETFSNAVHTGRRTSPPPEIVAEVEAIRSEGFPYQAALGLNDPPTHTRYRKLVTRAFLPRALRWMEPLVAAAARELAAALPDRGTVDVVEALARPLPVYAISRILGLSDAWRDDIARWSDAATATLGASAMPPERWLQVERDNVDFQQRIVVELDRRRESPTDDLLSSLVAPDPEEGTLTNAELVWLVRELVVAGNETTTKLVTDLVLRLNDRPDEWERLRAEPARAADVVEEGLRLASPAQGMFRRVTRPTALGDVDLPEGAIVFLAFGSANRDEAVFDDPDGFLPGRPAQRQHVAFGQGIHACVGNVLARMEAATVLREVADRVDRLEVVDPEGVRYLPSFFLRGVPRLPVVVHGRAGSPSPG
jgi:cytochrome P450